MLKKIFKKHDKKLTLIAIVLTAYIGCGGEAKDKSELKVVETTLAKKAMVTKHRAFDHFSKADLYERSGNYEKAADEYRLAMFYDPESNELKRSLASVIYNLQRYDEALEIYVQIEDPSIDDRLKIADCLNRTGSVSEAVELYQEVAESDSTPEPVIINLAEYYAKQGKLSEAEKYYRRLIETSANSDYWRLELAAAYLRSDKIKKAETIYENMMKTDSSDFRAYLGMAGVLERQDNIDAADSLYKLVADYNWEDARVLSMLMPSFIGIDDMDMAVNLARRIIELFPDDYLAQRRYALLLFSIDQTEKSDSVLKSISETVTDDPVVFYYRGRIAQANEEFNQAESLYALAITYDDTLHQAWINLAFTRNSLGDFENALATLDSTLTYCANDSLEVLYFTGTFLSREEKYEMAIEYYRRILAVEPDNIDVIFNMAAAYERLKQYNKAEEHFLILLDREPDNPIIMNYLGYMYADMGVKLNEAKKLIKKALKLSPDNSAYLDSYAWVMYKQGNYKEALKYQLKAMEAANDDPILYDHMGDIYSALNRIPEAQTNWHRALELDPENDSIKEKLK
ncbi:MAG: tetratricopeptide repeat protein [candidate division Zixibacteria bacterium]|nr:tetratricopeptide repeat protein [candidate division Zixibacteria bacterium]